VNSISENHSGNNELETVTQALQVNAGSYQNNK